MSIKKINRRRSNWYIYLITFVISGALLSFAVWMMWDVLFPTSSQPVMSSSGALDYRPDASYNKTMLLMLSENTGGVPEHYMMMNYRPRDEIIVLVPLNPNILATVANQEKRLSEHYSDSGAEGVIYAVESAFGVLCDYYVKFDEDAFVNFIDLAGIAPVAIPYTLDDENYFFLAGEHDFDGQTLYDYITYPDFNEGEDYRSVVIGSAISKFINKNSLNLTVTQMQSLFNSIINNTDTNLDFSVFTSNQSAYLYTTQNSPNLAVYYVPYGEHLDNGTFRVSENSILTIRDRFGLTE